METLYEQCSKILDDVDVGRANHLPSELTSALAERVAALAPAYREHEGEMIDAALRVFVRVDAASGRPRLGRSASTAEQLRHFYSDSRFDRLPEYGAGAGRRRPRPFEAVVETCRRLHYLDRIRRQLRGGEHSGGRTIPCSCVLGGSTSYGPFYNTIGAKDNRPSDLDLLLVVPSYELLDTVLDALSALTTLDPDGLDRCDKRIAQFAAVRESRTGEPCTFSEKLQAWNRDPDQILRDAQLPSFFGISLNVFDRDAFEQLVLTDAARIEQGSERAIADFRSREPRARSVERCFAGLVTEQQSERLEEPHPWTVRRQVFHIDADDRYYPGLHQNMVLPCFDVQWEAEEILIRPQLDAFKSKLRQRLRGEEVLRRHEVQRLSLSHTRSSVFAPHIVRNVDDKVKGET